jgi:hypothetical protein
MVLTTISKRRARAFDLLPSRGLILRRDSVTGVGIAFFWAPMRRRVTAFGKDCHSPVTG